MTLHPQPPTTRARGVAYFGARRLGHRDERRRLVSGTGEPAFTSPEWVFGPVWTALYPMIAVAGWRVWRRRGLAGAVGRVADVWALLAVGAARNERPRSTHSAQAKPKRSGPRRAGPLPKWLQYYPGLGGTDLDAPWLSVLGFQYSHLEHAVPQIGCQLSGVELS